MSRFVFFQVLYLVKIPRSKTAAQRIKHVILLDSQPYTIYRLILIYIVSLIRKKPTRHITVKI